MANEAFILCSEASQFPDLCDGPVHFIDWLLDAERRPELVDLPAHGFIGLSGGDRLHTTDSDSAVFFRRRWHRGSQQSPENCDSHPIDAAASGCYSFRADLLWKNNDSAAVRSCRCSGPGQ